MKEKRSPLVKKAISYKKDRIASSRETPEDRNVMGKEAVNRAYRRRVHRVLNDLPVEVDEEVSEAIELAAKTVRRRFLGKGKTVSLREAVAAKLIRRRVAEKSAA